MPKGFVYVLSNAVMPGIVKVGFTEVEYCCLVEDPAGLEARVHAAPSERRHRMDREFFRLTAVDAALEVAKHAGKVEHSWSKAPLARPWPARVQCTGHERARGLPRRCPPPPLTWAIRRSTRCRG